MVNYAYEDGEWTEAEHLRSFSNLYQVSGLWRKRREEGNESGRKYEWEEIDHKFKEEYARVLDTKAVDWDEKKWGVLCEGEEKKPKEWVMKIWVEVTVEGKQLG